MSRETYLPGRSSKELKQAGRDDYRLQTHLKVHGSMAILAIRYQVISKTGPAR